MSLSRYFAQVYDGNSSALQLEAIYQKAARPRRNPRLIGRSCSIAVGSMLREECNPCKCDQHP
jgi:hypothetical protein